VAEGAEVNAGDVLLRLHDPALAERIDRARIALSEADAALTRLEGRVAVERVRLADYQLINRTDRDIARAELAAHEQEVATLTRARDRALALHAEGHVAAARVEEAEAALALAEARSAAARLMTERTDALHTVAAARHHNGREFIVDLDLLALDLEEARAARDARAAELGALLALEGAQTVRAPWAGRVVDLLHQDGARLLRGAPLLALEREGAPIVEAWLTQEEVLEVGLGDTALIFLPALDRTLEARITRIDRTSGFVDEQRSQYTWRGPEDRSARVLLELEGAAAELPGGLPAITLFRRRNPSALREAVLGATDV
ncbi:MAG: HlyD family efflux transporter periplasmic adaptor subunit, partial [Pseudomonadota bacterium]